MSSIPLGPFVLHQPIGEGGMGTVWRGEHRTDGVPVAVKLLRTGQGWGPQAQQILQNEVRAVAALHHPAVVMLLDAGQTSSATAAASDGRIPARTPYLAMEMCTGGTLWPHRGRLPWSLLQPLLLSLLDALAHAHARGVIHRDLKPGNVLVGTHDDLRSGPKLTDFGIARLGEMDIFGEGTFAGSAPYAPPEQLMGRARLVGPWTDLYALGAMTWDLVCAQTPWRRLGLEGACMAKLAGNYPPWEPVLPMPQGLEGWIKRLLAPRPGDRPAYAADAAWALRRLEAPPDLGWAPAQHLPALGEVGQQSGTELLSFLRNTQHEPTADDVTHLDLELVSVLAESPVALGGVGQSAGPGGLGGPTDPSAPRPGRSERPPLLDDWRRRDPPAPPMQLVGAGLALYSLRTLAMVDREVERDAIWRALHDVARTGAAHCVLVRGDAGVGKSRLVQWMSERANELGVATTLVAQHGPTGGHRDGIGPMVMRRLNLDGLPDAEAREGLAGQLKALGDSSDWLSNGLLGLVLPYSPEGERLRERRPEERIAVAVRYIGLLAKDRPVLLWLDDLQWGVDAVALALALLAGRRLRRHPVLVVGTVRNPDVVPGSGAAQGLQSLAGGEATQTLELEPLPEEDQRELVGELLRLDPVLRNEVVQRTGGNPLFAVQLVGDWVRRGILVPSGDGFVRAQGASATLPDDIHSLWSQRFDEAMADQPDATRSALELGAALGERVDIEEWLALCTEAGLGGVSGLPEELAAHGLVFSEARQWAFVHAMARESVERASRETGRWADANAAAARLLQGRAGPDAAARRARHHLAAEAWNEAARDLRTAIEAWLPRAEIAAATDAIAQRQQSLDSLRAAKEDPRRLENTFYRSRLAWLQQKEPQLDRLRGLSSDAARLGLRALHAETLRELGTQLRDLHELPESIEVLRASVSEAEEIGSDAVLARALPSLGWSLLHSGDQGAARRVLRRAAAVCARTEPRGMAIAYAALASSYRRDQRMDQATTYAERGLDVAEQLGDAFLIAGACAQMAAIHSESDNPTAARPLLAKARGIYDRLGSLGHLVGLHSQEGNVLRSLGRLEEAENTLEAGIELQRDKGGWMLGLLRANLGKVQLEGKRWKKAKASFEASSALFRASGRAGMGDLLDLLRLPALVALGQRDEFVVALEACEEASARWKRFDVGTWEAIGVAITEARSHGWAEADRLTELAAKYRALNPS